MSPIPIRDAVNIPCLCKNPHTVLNVTCVYMDRLEEIKVQHCLKRPAAIQLLELGLFPCMPVQPGLAVSLVMLEWACTLFLHMASNMQAWADTVEIMLKCQGYSFRKSHSFCCHFNNVLVHYQMVIRLVEADVRACLRPGMYHILVLTELRWICRMGAQGDGSLLNALSRKCYMHMLQYVHRGALP